MSPASPPASLGIVLLVDDEPNVLSALRRAFSGAAFRTVAASGGAEALERLARESVDLVLTDVRMPGMDGVRLLEEVRRRHPGVDRAILSGHVERETAVASVATGVARAFFSKPWEAQTLQARIEALLRTRKLLSRQGLLELISGAGHLPALPPVYNELVQAMSHGRAMAEIAKVIERDVALAARVMQVASSAFYGQRDVTTVGRALSVLGLEATRDITLVASMVSDPSWAAVDQQEIASVVVHSILTNRLTGEAYRMRNGRNLEGSSSVGLLHDAGRYLLLRHFPERYREIRARSQRDGNGFYAAELVLGYEETSHARLGGYLLDSWNMPQILVETALHHVNPVGADEQYRPVLEALAFADEIARSVTDDGSWASDASVLGYLDRVDTERLTVDAGRMALAVERLLSVP